MRKGGVGKLGGNHQRERRGNKGQWGKSVEKLRGNYCRGRRRVNKERRKSREMRKGRKGKVIAEEKKESEGNLG